MTRDLVSSIASWVRKAQRNGEENKQTRKPKNFGNTPGLKKHWFASKCVQASSLGKEVLAHAQFMRHPTASGGFAD